MVSKRSCGEPHFPSLLFDTVSVSSLEEENSLISDSWHKQYRQGFTRLLHFSGFTPSIGRRTTEISVLVLHLPPWSPGELDACGIRLSFKAGQKLFS